MAKVHKGPPLSLSNDALHDYVFKCMEQYGNKTCLINKATVKEYKFAETIHLAKSVAAGLTKLGVSKGDIIVFLKRTSASIVIMLLGSVAAGIQVCFCNPASTSYELIQYMSELGSMPKYIFTDVDMVAKLGVVFNDHAVRLIIDGDTNSRDDVPLWSFMSTVHTPALVSGDSDDPRTSKAVILFSSGTTGKPKAVVLSHANILAAIKMIGTRTGTTGTSLAVFPIYHVAGIMNSISNIVNGVTMVFYPEFDFKEFLHGIELYRVEQVGLPPPIIVMMTKSPLVKEYDLSSLRMVVTGASSTSAELEIALKHLLHNVSIGQVYGLTETTAACIGFPEGCDIIKQGSVGKVYSGIEVKVMDPSSGQILGPNKHGELWIRGPSIMMGYLNNPDATRKIVDENGWLHSGDIGYYDEDDWFYIIGRTKELVKYKGFQVAPAELDAVLLNHPDITDAGVTGKPDLEAGELPCAFVVKRPGSNITASQVMDFVKDRVSYYKYLRGGVHFVDVIPKLPSGKILRRQLKEMLLEPKANL